MLPLLRMKWQVGKKRNKGRNFGHINVKTVKKIVEASVILKIPIVTFLYFH